MQWILHKLASSLKALFLKRNIENAMYKGYNYIYNNEYVNEITDIVFRQVF